MAKGARSNSLRKLHTWRRTALKAAWQDEADARRYAALQEVLEQPAPPPPEPKEPTEEELQEEQQRKQEKREARQARRRVVKPLLPIPEQRGPTAMEAEGQGAEEGKQESKSRKAGRKGVQKKHRKGKGFLVGTKAAFHPKKRR
jgi:hypothetical protein